MIFQKELGIYEKNGLKLICGGKTLLDLDKFLNV